jgi:hypothetical protein
LLDEQGQSLNVVAWLQQAPADTQSRLVVFEHEGQHFSGRLIAYALSAEAAERARARARKKASKQQRELKEETLFLAGWLLVFTSLPTDPWSDQHVLALYRARWQVELVIKRMKQVLGLAQLRGKTALTNEASILALLVCWALQQQEAQLARQVLSQAVQQVALLPAAAADPSAAAPGGAHEPREGAVSSWLLTAVCVQTLCVVVQGYWTPARLRACLPQLRRFVRGSPRLRQQQESTIRLSLAAHLGLPAPGSSLFFSCLSP